MEGRDRVWLFWGGGGGGFGIGGFEDWRRGVRVRKRAGLFGNGGGRVV